MKRFSSTTRLTAKNNKLTSEKSEVEKAKADFERAAEVLKTDPSNEKQLEALRLAKVYRDLSSKAKRTAMQLKSKLNANLKAALPAPKKERKKE